MQQVIELHEEETQKNESDKNFLIKKKQDYNNKNKKNIERKRYHYFDHIYNSYY